MYATNASNNRRHFLLVTREKVPSAGGSISMLDKKDLIRESRKSENGSLSPSSLYYFISFSYIRNGE
jgi:hypothetical protein